MIKAFLKAQRRIIYVQISSSRIALESNDGLRWEAIPEVGISIDNTELIETEGGTTTLTFELSEAPPPEGTSQTRMRMA